MSKQRDKWDLAEVERVLGGIPETVVGFVDLYCQRNSIFVDLAMNIGEEDAGTEGEPGQFDFSDDEDEDNEDDYLYDIREAVEHVTKPTLFELRRDIRLCNRDLELGYQLGAIDDAINKYLQVRSSTRIAEILTGIRYDPSLGKSNYYVEDEWEKLADAIFEEPRLSTQAKIAVMKGTIWQIKRKMIGRVVKQHFMWVMIGPQGSGKSTAMTRFTHPLKDARKLNVNFEMLLDPKYISLWRLNFLMFLDEMQNATAANRDAVKALITAPYVIRRPMRTNADIQIRHNVTFVGASNNRFSDMIKDPTGIRRFVPTRCRRHMDWEVINEIDFYQLWQSVNETSRTNPASEYWDEISELQEANRVKTPVEEWSVAMVSDQDTRDKYAVWTDETDMFKAYREWEEKNYPKQERTIRRYFYQEMNDQCEAPNSLWEHEDRKYRIRETEL